MTDLLLVAQVPGAGARIAIVVLLLAALAFPLLVLLVHCYKRCPPSRVLVIYGKTRSGAAVECIHGGARLVWPLIQDYGWLSLDPMRVEVPLRVALSAEKTRVNLPSAFTVAIGTTPELMQNAAIRLLGLSTEEIQKQAQDIISSQWRQVVASMAVEGINADRDKLPDRIKELLEPELRKIGLVLINVQEPA